jgi:hypothetical protein
MERRSAGSRFIAGAEQWISSFGGAYPIDTFGARGCRRRAAKQNVRGEGIGLVVRPVIR